MRKVQIYTDGSSLGNPGPGGFGTVVVSGEKRREYAVGYQCTTNNRMEILAAIAGLEVLPEACEVAIYSDSKYVVDAIDKGWINGWKRRGWQRAGNQPLKNADLWERMDKSLAEHTVTAHWVKGHAGHVENERCDALATGAARGEKLHPDHGYLG